MIPVIICGGFGTKLWPVSREHRPKHFIKLLGDKSLFQLNYEALLTRFKAREIYVSTNQNQVDFVEKQAPDIPKENYIVEPEMRNQGPATGLIAAFLYKKGLADEPFMIIQVDDLREPTEKFIAMMDECDKLTRVDSRYITGGIKPKFPVMGVDYLIKGEQVNSSSIGVYKVKEFVWRGSKEQTEELLKNPDILIHANHTCMTPNNMLLLFKKYKPDWYEPLANYINGKDLNIEYLKMPPGPLEDITQKVYESGESLVIELPFEWHDFGTFEAIDEYLRSRNLYNVGENIVDVDGESNFIRLDDPNKIVALVGVDNLVVIDTGDVLLITNKKASGKVGEVLKEVKKRKLSLT